MTYQKELPAPHPLIQPEKQPIPPVTWKPHKIATVEAWATWAHAIAIDCKKDAYL